MENRVELEPGRVYIVVKSFIDYDGIMHDIGEKWTYQGTNFVPYDDGLSLHVLIDDKECVYRFQLLKEEQADIIEHFKTYVIKMI